MKGLPCLMLPAAKTPLQPLTPVSFLTYFFLCKYNKIPLSWPAVQLPFIFCLIFYMVDIVTFPKVVLHDVRKNN